MAPANFSAAEYQLIESVHHGLLGRLYSPAPLNTENSKRTIIRTERNNTVVYFKTTASDHLAIASQCKASNLLANRVRTNQLLLKVKQGIIDPMGTPTPAELAATLATAPAKAPHSRTHAYTGGSSNATCTGCSPSPPRVFTSA